HADDHYDYSRVQYVNYDHHVTIICPTHGEFQTTPRQHLKSSTRGGCKRCFKSKPSPKKHQTSTFIKKAKQIHHDLYDYSKVHYVDSSTPVTIVCPVHGDFS